MAATSGGHAGTTTYAKIATTISQDYNLVEVSKFLTKWFQPVGLNRSMGKMIKAVDAELAGLVSVRNCGMQVFGKVMNNKLFKCYAYAVTFDQQHPDFQCDIQKLKTLESGNAALKEIDQLDNNGEPMLEPVKGLEFLLPPGLVNNNFEKVIVSSIKKKFERFANFSSSGNATVSFENKKSAVLRMQADEILKRPKGTFDIRIDSSGRYFSVKARCFGVAPGEDNVPFQADGETKKCHKCGSIQHLVADCPLRRKNRNKNNVGDNNDQNNNMTDVEKNNTTEEIQKTANSRPGGQPPRKSGRISRPVQSYQAGLAENDSIQVRRSNNSNNEVDILDESIMTLEELPRTEVGETTKEATSDENSGQVMANQSESEEPTNMTTTNNNEAIDPIIHSISTVLQNFAFLYADEGEPYEDGEGPRHQIITCLSKNQLYQLNNHMVQFARDECPDDDPDQYCYKKHNDVQVPELEVLALTLVLMKRNGLNIQYNEQTKVYNYQTFDNCLRKLDQTTKEKLNDLIKFYHETYPGDKFGDFVWTVANKPIRSFKCTTKVLS